MPDVLPGVVGLASVAMGFLACRDEPPSGFGRPGRGNRGRVSDVPGTCLAARPDCFLAGIAATAVGAGVGLPHLATAGWSAMTVAGTATLVVGTILLVAGVGLTDADPPIALRAAASAAAPRPTLLIAGGNVPDEAYAARHIQRKTPACRCGRCRTPGTPKI